MNHFIYLVAQMRQTQKEYFKTRDPETLKKSKQLERSVDENIRVLNEKNKVGDVTLELTNEEARLLQRILTQMSDVWDWNKDLQNPLYMQAKVELLKEKSYPDTIHSISGKLPKIFKD